MHILNGNVVGVSAKASPYCLRPATVRADVLPYSVSPSAIRPRKLRRLPNSRLVSVELGRTGMSTAPTAVTTAACTRSRTPTTTFTHFDVHGSPQRIKKLPPGTEPTLHGGTSVADAIVLVRRPNDAIRLQSEQAFLALHPCTEGGAWHTTLANPRP